MYGLVTVALTRQEFGAKGGRAEDAQIVIGSDQDGQVYKSIFQRDSSG